MRAIAEPFFSGSAHLLGPTLALTFFVAFFVLVTVAALRTRPSELDRAAALPLAEEKRSS
jgi:hypothetical protein